MRDGLTLGRLQYLMPDRGPETYEMPMQEAQGRGIVARWQWMRPVLAVLVMAMLLLPAAAKEKPFFQVDPNATGPLTLSELQIHIPSKIADTLTAGRRACYIAEVGRLAAEAGDPQKADPVRLGYMPDKRDWNKLDRFSRRLILAQAILSRAIVNC